MAEAFFWGQGGQRLSPAQAASRRKIADSMLANTTAATTFGGGLAKIGDALKGIYYDQQADIAEQSGANERKAVLDALMGNPDPGMTDIYSALSNEWVSSDPASMAVLQAMMGQENQQADWARQDALREEDRAYNQPLRDAQLTGANLANETAAFQLDQLRNPPAQMPEYAWETMPDGTLIRTDKTSGEVVPMGQFPKGQDPTSAIQNFEYLVGTGTDPAQAQEMAFGASTNIDVNLGDGAPGLGKLSTDFGYVLDPVTREPVIDQATGLPTAAPVPGSPAAREIEAAAAAAAVGDQQQDTYADVVKEDIGRALTLLESDPTFTTGIFGQLLGNWTGSNADRLDQFLNTVRSNVAFDRLQAMREASPTGGALGSVTERELKLLESTIGSLERSDPEDLAYNLKRVQEIYDRVMEKAAAYPNAAQFGFGGSAPQSTVDPADIDALLELYQ